MWRLYYTIPLLFQSYTDHARNIQYICLTPVVYTCSSTTYLAFEKLHVIYMLADVSEGLRSRCTMYTTPAQEGSWILRNVKNFNYWHLGVSYPTLELAYQN